MFLKLISFIIKTVIEKIGINVESHQIKASKFYLQIWKYNKQGAFIIKLR